MASRRKIISASSIWNPAALTLAAAVCSTVSAKEKPAKPVIEFRLGQLEPGERLTEMTVDGKKVYVAKNASLTGDDIASAMVQEGKGADGAVTYEIELRMTKAGGDRLAELTEKNRKKLMAILIDGKLITAPIIREKIRDRAAISGKFTKAEAERLAERIGGK